MKRFEIEELGWPENLQTAINNGITPFESYVTIPSNPDKVENMMKDFLPERSFDILMARYKEYKAVLQIGHEHGLSYERVRQILYKSHKDLRILFSCGCDIKTTDIRDMPIPLYFKRINDASRALRIAASAVLGASKKRKIIVILKPVNRSDTFKTETYPFVFVSDLITAIRSGVITEVKGIAEITRQVLIDQLVKDGIDISELVGRDEK